MKQDVYSKRADEILHKMTIDEKLAQLGSIWVYELFKNGKLSDIFIIANESIA